MIKESAYDTCGSGPAAVLVHGSMNSRKQWKKLYYLLEEAFTVIAQQFPEPLESPLVKGSRL